MQEFVVQYGVFALAVLLFIDDFGIPLPASTLIFSTAVLARTNTEMSVLLLFLVAVLIPPISNGTLFFLGKRGARNWLHRHGHRIYLTEKRMHKAESFFRKYGDKAVFIVAMLTSIRPVTSIIAGSMDMNPRRFFAFHMSGIICWASFLIGSGYLLGEHIWKIVRGSVEGIVGGILLFFLVKFVVQCCRKK